MTLKSRIQDDIKRAMKDRNSQLLGVLRLLTAGIKQAEIDGKRQVDDLGVIAILRKMAKQRKESIKHYKRAQRDDLINIESFELKVLEEYLPDDMPASELKSLIDLTVDRLEATKISQMGQVIADLKGHLKGNVDMGEVVKMVKQRLTN